MMKALCVVALLGVSGVAFPKLAHGEPSGATEHTAFYDTANGAITKRQFVPIEQGLPGVLEYASETFAAQVEGAATSLDHLKCLCDKAPKLTARLEQQGYNTTFITNTICDASKKSTLATDDEIKNKTLEASTKIWIVQALRATGGNFNKLCNIIDVDAANSIGLDGAFVKQEICGVGG